MSKRLAALALASPLLASACFTTRVHDYADPTVRVHTPGAGELGVSTEYGVVFLGRGASEGPVEFTIWFDDGPSLEAGTIESVGGGLYLTFPEIRLPTAAMTFVEPPPGTAVLVRGRDASGPWELDAEVVAHPGVDGILLRADRSLGRLSADQTGAGVYVEGPDGTALVGLVSGRLRLSGGEGPAEVVTVVGPRELWRVVTFHRNLERRPRTLRDDVL